MFECLLRMIANRLLRRKYLRNNRNSEIFSLHFYLRNNASCVFCYFLRSMQKIAFECCVCWENSGGILLRWRLIYCFFFFFNFIGDLGDLLPVGSRFSTLMRGFQLFFRFDREGHQFKGNLTSRLKHVLHLKGIFWFF